MLGKGGLLGEPVASFDDQDDDPRAQIVAARSQSSLGTINHALLQSTQPSLGRATIQPVKPNDPRAL